MDVIPSFYACGAESRGNLGSSRNSDGFGKEDENECSIDAILGKSPDKRTQAEKAVVERYLDELYPDRRESNENDRSTENTENTGNAENTENAENTGGDNGQKRLPGGVGDELPFEGPTGPTGPNDTGAPEDANTGRAGNGQGRRRDDATVHRENPLDNH